LDVEAHLTSKNIQDAMLPDNGSTLQHKAQALILIQHHLADPLKQLYMNEYKPCVLWDELKSRFDHIQTIFLLAARHDWINLRVHNHKSIVAFNGELF
jgi:hypothetical protein